MGVITVRLASDNGQRATSPDIAPVSMSLVTGDGMCAVRADDGTQLDIEVEIGDALKIQEWLCTRRIASATDPDDPTHERSVFLLMEEAERLIVPYTLDPKAPEDFHVVAFESTQRQGDGIAWYGLDAWIGTRAEAVASRGLDLHMVAEDHDLTVGIGLRPTRDDQPVVVVVASRPLQQHEVWRRAVPYGAGFALVGQAPAGDESWRAAGQLAILAFREAGAHPLDVFPTVVSLVPSRSENANDPQDGGAPREKVARRPVPRLQKSRGHGIEALHIPSSSSADVELVTVDRRNAVRWYPYVSGGPVEAAQVSLADAPNHELYVNSNQTSFEPPAVNGRATSLLRASGVRMVHNEIRGDALLMKAPGKSGYPRSVDQALLDALWE